MILTITVTFTAFILELLKLSILKNLQKDYKNIYNIISLVN